MTAAEEPHPLAFGFDGDQLYSWDARDGRGRGACGVTRHGDRVTALLINAIGTLAPGATGSIQLVRLDRWARRPSYVHGEVLVRIHRDEMTGEIVLDRYSEC